MSPRRTGRWVGGVSGAKCLGGTRGRPLAMAQGDYETSLEGVVPGVDNGAEAALWRMNDAKVRLDYPEWHDCGWHWRAARLSGRCGHQAGEDCLDQWPDQGLR